MSFFLSSPPQPTYQKSHHLSHPQHSFFTPQLHRTTYSSDSVSWPSFQFQPTSPSPLRPSWNAGNVMRQHHNDTKGTGDDHQSVSDGELAGWENSRDTGSSPFAAYTSTSHGTSEAAQLPSIPGATATTTTRFTPQQPRQTEPIPPRNPFQFQSHSQSSRPTSQINSRIRTNRDTRRSLFLDRLRSSRRDERDNNIIEKFEKEEYWRDRRRREERMSREAEVQIGWEDEADDSDGGEEELSPIDEEKEVGELVEGWFEQQQKAQNRDQDQDQNQNQSLLHESSRGQHQQQEQEDDFMDAQLDFEDSDVEEAFMQVLSQQNQLRLQPQQSIDESISRIRGADTGGNGNGNGSGDTREQHGNVDRDAEMS